MEPFQFNNDLIREVYTCNRCGYCRSVCPTSSEIKWEGSSPRGKIYYLKKILEGKINKIDPKFVERTFQCALCDQCNAVCSQSIDHLNLWKAVRAELGRRDLWPQPIKKITASIEANKNVYSIPNEERNFWAFEIEDLVMPRLNRKAEVCFFVGCVSSFSLRMASIPESIVRIMDAAEVDYTMLGQDEWCCADPLLLCVLEPKGSRLSEELVEHNIEKIRKLGVETMVTACAGCYRAFKNDYPKILGEELGFEVIHESEFISRLIDNNTLKLRKKREMVVTYHDPCEIGRHVGVFEPPRKILENIPGLKFNELIKTRKDCNCCGGGGLIEATNPELALAIASKKLNEAREVGAEGISSCCPACKINLLNSVQDNNGPMEIFDIAELVASAL